eukprot:366019-Chlamydomonas_euryale.AAC.2
MGKHGALCGPPAMRPAPTRTGSWHSPCNPSCSAPSAHHWGRSTPKWCPQFPCVSMVTATVPELSAGADAWPGEGVPRPSYAKAQCYIGL